MEIIDVSRYQKAIDWAKVAASGKVDGVMLKTVSTNKAYGGIYIDPTFEKNYWGAREVGLPVGAYYYTYAQDEARAKAELEKFKMAVRGKVFELPLAVDVEDNKLKPLSRKALTDLVKMEAKEIETWGFYTMVYTYTSYANTELDMDALSVFDLWIADYRGTRPTRKHGMWQYTSTGSVEGIRGNVDISHAYKDYPGIIRKAGLTGNWG